MILRRLAIALIALYAILTLVLTIRGVLGYPYVRGSTELLTLLAFCFAWLHAGLRLGWRQAILLGLLSTGISLALESLGVATGWVYGPYHYTDLLGPKFLGLVPYLIPIAWFMMMYPSFVMATWLAPARVSYRLLVLAATGGLIMTSWDLVMDPMMVEIGHWAWEVDGAYFGVPLQNYWGWWLTTFFVFAVFLMILPGQRGSTLGSGNPREAKSDRLVVVSYLTTGFSSIVTAGLLGLWGPALVGLFAMAPWALISWWRMGEEHA